MLRTIAAALSLAPALASAEGRMTEWRGNETPPATVIWSEETEAGVLELRDYDPHIVAEVTVRGGSRAGAASAGFRRLAGYIFGGNASADGGSKKIAMTSPVGQVQEGGVWTISFTMPARWSMDTLPAPRDAAVRLREDPGGRRLSLGFSGRWTQSGLEARAEALKALARERGLTPEGPAAYLFYDGPMTPALLRRNEVSVAVR